MIFFCEDCGEKNLLTPDQLISGKAVFRCSACGYMNAYAFETDRAPDVEPADVLINHLKSFPEIIGSFLFDCTAGVLTNYMPALLKTRDLEFLGKTLFQNFSIFYSLYPDTDEMALIISGKNMILKMITRDIALIIAAKTFPLSGPVQDQLTALVSMGMSHKEPSK